MNPLVGKVIESIWLADDKEAIKFKIQGEAEPIIALAYGDCCSHTWIENAENVEAILGHPVLASDNVDLDREEGKDGYDVIKFYGFNIDTIGGTCKIDFRNSSNGYYGGDLTWPNNDWNYAGGNSLHSREANDDWTLLATL